jgi:cbb3-type cytochrome oxidase subunit 3
VKLSDVMSAMGLAGYAEVALVIFFVAFLAVVAHVLHRRNHATFERARHLPLDADPPLDPDDNAEAELPKRGDP